MIGLPRVFSGLDRESLVLLVERAERLRGRRGSQALEEGGWIAEFSFGGQAYALPLEQVLSCAPIRAVSSVPLAARGVVGILRFHGRVLRVLSFSALLGGRGWRRDPSVALILRQGPQELGLDCEEIPRVGQLSAANHRRVRDADPGKGVVELEAPSGAALHYLRLGPLLDAFGG